MTARLHHYFALALLLALVSFCGCKPANAPQPREMVRGAIFGMANSIDLATNVCARVWAVMDEETPDAKRLFGVCKSSWDEAEASLEAADKLVDVWDAAVTAPKVACLAGRALSALAAVMRVLREFDVKMDAALVATLDDGIRLGEWLVKLAPGGTCALPKAVPA